MKSLISKITKWFKRRYVPPVPYDPYSPVVYSREGYYEPSPFAKLVSNIGKSWKQNWKDLTIIVLTFLLLIATVILIFRK